MINFSLPHDPERFDDLTPDMLSSLRWQLRAYLADPWPMDSIAFETSLRALTEVERRLAWTDPPPKTD